MTDRPTPGPADVPWLRDALHDVTDARPVPDARQAILDRADGTGPSPIVVPLASPGDGRWSTRHKLAAAAVVLGLVAIAGAVTLTGDDDSTPVTTTPGEPTGWYVPSALPDGWEVTMIETIPEQIDSEDCPCQLMHSIGPGAYVAGYRTTFAGPPPGPDDPPGVLLPGLGGDGSGRPISKKPQAVDVAPGIPGWRTQTRALLSSNDEYDIARTWVSGGTLTHLISAGLGESEQADLVAKWAATDDQEDLPSPAGFEVVNRTIVPAGAESVVDVFGTIRIGSASAHFSLSALDETVPLDLAAPDIEHLETPDVPGSAGVLSEGNGPGDAAYRGQWPGGATLTISGSLGENEGEATPAQVTAIARSFRPATAQEWATFVSSTTHSPAAIAPTIRDLIVRTGETGPDTEGGLVGPDGEPPPVVGEPAAPPPPGGGESEGTDTTSPETATTTPPGDEGPAFEVLAVDDATSSTPPGSLGSAVNASEYADLWDRSLVIHDAMAEVDFDRWVVVSISIPVVGCVPPTLTHFVPDGRVFTPNFVKSPTLCARDTHLVTYVVQLEREAIAPAFTLQVLPDRNLDLPLRRLSVEVP